MLNQAFLFCVLDEGFHKLYQGNVIVLESIQYFKLKNIRTILVIGPHKYSKFPQYITYHNLDDNINEMVKTFEKACSIVTTSIKQSSVLICCGTGLNYSASVVISYLMKTKNWQYEKAFYHVKSLKSLINPSIALKKQLILFNTKVQYQSNQESQKNLQNSTSITLSKFQQRIIEQKEKQKYFEESIPSIDEIHSTESQKGNNTPGFQSPITQNTAISSSKQGYFLKKQFGKQFNPLTQSAPAISKMVKHLRNYTFQLDDNLQHVEQVKAQESPKFNNFIEEDPEEEKIRLRHRRRRTAHRTKSVISQN